MIKYIFVFYIIFYLSHSFSQINDLRWLNVESIYCFETDFLENSKNKQGLINDNTNQNIVFQDSTDILMNNNNSFLSINTFYGFPFYLGLGGGYHIDKSKIRTSLTSHYVFGQKWAEKYHGLDVGIQMFYGDKWVFTYGVNFLMLFNIIREYHENTPNPNHHVLSIFEPNINIGVGYSLKSFDFLLLPNFSFYRYYRFVYHFGESGNDTRNYFKTIPRIVINFKF